MAGSQPAKTTQTALPKRIDHYAPYWRHVVIPDLQDFMNAQDDIRLAFHCAGSLFQLSDWVYEAER
jgi:hypothetical protein